MMAASNRNGNGNGNGNGNWDRDRDRDRDRCRNWAGGVDLRQLLAALLTVCMFLMLAHMIASDHLSSSSSSSLPSLQHNAADENEKLIAVNNATTATLSPCWPPPSASPANSTSDSIGFVTFSLGPSPAHHISQVTDAVVIARYLGAALLLPDIRRHQLGLSRNFEHMYDLDNFFSALTGVVQVTKHLPHHMLTRQPAVLRIKNRLSQYKIETQILPAFKRNNYLRLALVYQSAGPHPSHLYTDNDLLATSCVAMFRSLQLQPGLQQVGDKMIGRLRELAAQSNGEFVAIDWKRNVIGESGCTLDAVPESRRCYNASEVVSLLRKAGFGEETVVYSTEDAGWHESLKILKNSFPKTYTKDEILPAEERDHFLKAGNEDLGKALDLHVCSKSDTFVAAVYGPFYSHVSGRRITSGLTRILSPLQLVSEKGSDFVSPFVSKKSHMAYSCYC